MPDNVHRLMPLNVGECTLGENHLLGDPYSDDQRVAFTLYSFLADGGPGRRVLVDLGPVSLGYVNWMFRRYSFFRNLSESPDDLRQPRGNVFDWLGRMQLSPEDIDHVVLTHLHADHHGMDDGKGPGGMAQFPNARIHVSKTGWEENLRKRVGGRWNSYVDYAFSDFLVQMDRQGRVVWQDQGEVAPGVTVSYLGGHSVCSLAVRIETESGPAVICSDEVYLYGLLERGIIARLRVTHARLLAATERLVAMAEAGATLLPCHDPCLSELYEDHGDDWLRYAKAISDRAVAGFRRTGPKLVEQVAGDAVPPPRVPVDNGARPGL